MKIVLALMLVGLLEADYRFYDFKGKAAFGPNPVYRMLPGFIQDVFRDAGKFWARVTGRSLPVTLLPDHVTVCFPPSVNNEHANKELPQWVQALEYDAAQMMRAVARRWAKPGITYDENLDKADISLPQSGVWIGYVEEDAVAAYRNGERWPLPVSLRDYMAYPWNYRCGNTTHHEEGPGYWNEYAVTFEGKFIPVD